MLLTREVLLKINNRYVKYYTEKGYNIKGGDEIMIKIEDMSEQSHIIVDVKCDICGKEQSIKYYNYVINKKNQNVYGCFDCKKVKTQKTNINKYGVTCTLQSVDVLNKIKEQNIENFGVEHYSKSNEFKEKVKTTNLQKYGNSCSLQSEEIKEKSKQTCIEKYNVEHFSKHKDFKEKTQNTMITNYGMLYVKTKEFKESLINKMFDRYKDKGINMLRYINDGLIEIECEKGHISEISIHLIKTRRKYNVEICTICNPLGSINSGKENRLLEFIQDNYDGEIIENSRDIISPKELDIYLPDLNLAFEFNGVYWHSELYCENNYHLNKTESCIEKDIQLIHVWEDDWTNKQEIVKSMILNKLKVITEKIYARKCVIKVINDNKLVKSFLDTNHIQGFVGSSIKLGLYFNDELFTLMTFGKKRKFMNSVSKEGEYELLRFCNKLNTNVVGGASKLFKYFTKNYSFTEITTYADRSHSQGNLYETLGFKFIHKTESNYYYVIDGIRHHRFGFRKDVLVKEGFNKNKTEHEIMIERGISRIYDSGSLKYTIKKEN